MFSIVGWLAGLLALAPGSQNTQNKTLEAHSGHIWHLVTKMLKMSLLRLILAKSRARQPECSKQGS